MNWFKNLKISVKLISSFLLVALIAGFIGIMAMTNIKTLDDRDTFLYEKTTLPLAYLGNMSSYFQRIRAVSAFFVISENQQELEGYLKRTDEFDKIFNENSKLYESTYIDNDDKKEHEVVKENYAKFYNLVMQQYTFALNNKVQEAKLLMTKGDLRQQSIITQDLIAKMVENNVKIAKQTSDENTEKANAVNRIMIITIILGMFLAILLGLFISRIISKPIKVIEAAAKKVSEGNLKVQIDINTKDELGILANAFNTMITNFRNLIQKVIVQTESINNESEELSSISDVAASASAELQAQSQTASASSEQISANVSTVASSAEEMTASIKEISLNTTSSSTLTKESEQRANEASTVMNRLGVSSQEIGNIVKSITTIAEQTNLLALNATIEAARAGESGKGFAVVANEVKELAKEAARATEDITNKIKAIQNDTTNAVEVIRVIIENAEKVNEVTNSIASSIEEQSVTTNEVNRNLSEATIGVHSMVEVISGIYLAANDYAKQAGTIKNSSDTLKTMAHELETEIKNNFKF